MKIHFIGIGGIGMSALALLAIQKGHQVSGSDISQSSICRGLEDKGATIFYSHSEANIQEKMMVVISTAIDSNNIELLKAKNLHCSILHRSDFLKELMQGKTQIMISGAHGKTTTTALLVHVFKTAGLNPSYAIGGLVSDADHAEYYDSEYFIFEGDESDGSFLNHEAKYAIFTNIDQEHLDYWGNFENLLSGFKKAIQSIQDPTHVMIYSEDEYLNPLASKCAKYGTMPTDQLVAEDIHFTASGMRFTLEGEIFNLSLYGKHNVMNALGCYGIARKCGISLEMIKKAFSTFKGVKRRFEFLGTFENTRFVDDYAHHPVEIQAVLDVIKQIADIKRVLIIFEPHRYSRFQALKDDFAKVLSQASDLIVLPIYSANQMPITGLLESFCSQVSSERLYQLDQKKVLEFLTNHYKNYDWVFTLGAGNVTNIGRNFLKEQAFQHAEKILC